MIRTGLFILLGGILLAAAAPAQDEGVIPQDTIIRSKGPLRMKNNGTEAWFELSEEVVLTGTNLQVTCDRLQVFAERTVGDPARPAAIGRIQSIRRILATGNVVITQEGRKATAEQVEVLPNEEVIILTGSPVLSDPGGTYKGSRMIFRRGEQEAEIEDPELIMRSLPNLGFPGEGAAPAPQPEPEAPATAPAEPAAPTP